jgi:heme/copper-type cytochrome/quinol oxidase subunit 1
MRAFFFWIITLTAIFIGTSALVGSGPVAFTLSSPLSNAPDLAILQDRAALLGIGLTAMVISYRSAWVNWKNSRKA